MAKFKVLILPEARANLIVQFILDENEENQGFAREQILALCQFYEDNKPDLECMALEPKEEDNTDD